MSRFASVCKNADEFDADCFRDRPDRRLLRVETRPRVRLRDNRYPDVSDGQHAGRRDCIQHQL